MLDHALREQLLRLFEGLEASYVFDVTADPGHASRGELLELLEETAACSAKIGCRITDGQGLEFRLLRNDKDTGIHFRAVPNGHEFSSLILAVLNADGKGKNLPDEATRRRIGALGGQIALTTYMSLTCTAPMWYRRSTCWRSPIPGSPIRPWTEPCSPRRLHG